MERAVEMEARQDVAVRRVDDVMRAASLANGPMRVYLGERTRAMIPISKKSSLICGGTASDSLRTADSTLVQARTAGIQTPNNNVAGQKTGIDANGFVVDSRVQRAISPAIERGPMGQVHGIIVHQTGGATSSGTLEEYKKKDSNGAHFLIDKDGTIYQTASVKKQTWHVGKLKSRCLLEKKCSKAELKNISKLKIPQLSKYELAKSWPERYPANGDSIGIELVGRFNADKDQYEAVTTEQNASLAWLIRELSSALGLSMTEVFRHPDVSYKQPSEAATATW